MHLNPGRRGGRGLPGLVVRRFTIGCALFRGSPAFFRAPGAKARPGAGLRLLDSFTPCAVLRVLPDTLLRARSVLLSWSVVVALNVPPNFAVPISLNFPSTDLLRLGCQGPAPSFPLATQQPQKKRHRLSRAAVMRSLISVLPAPLFLGQQLRLPLLSFCSRSVGTLVDCQVKNLIVFPVKSPNLFRGGSGAGIIFMLAVFRSEPIISHAPFHQSHNPVRCCGGLIDEMRRYVLELGRATSCCLALCCRSGSASPRS